MNRPLMNRLPRNRLSTPSRLVPRRRLRLEPLEDRRMLSATLFVDADAPAGGDGLTWSTAYDNLQSALESAETVNTDGIAENDVEAIWIAEGVYIPSAELEPVEPRSASFSLVDDVTLYGGFAGTETAPAQRDWATHETILSGDLGVVDDTSDNAYTVAYCGEGVTAGLDGVTVTGGKADGRQTSWHPEREDGGGIYSFGTLTLTNSTLSRNTARGERSGAGGGIYNRYGNLTIINSTLSDNTARGGYGADGGGAIYNYKGTLTVTSSTLSKNSVTSDGGGAIYNYDGTLTFTDGTLLDNSADEDGGAICCNHDGVTTITNSTLVANSADDDGGAIFSRDGTLTVTNCTLAENRADDVAGGIYSDAGRPLTLANSILWGNRGGDLGGDLGGREPANAVSRVLIGIDPMFVRNPSDGGDEWGDNPYTYYVDESANDDFGDLRLTEQSPAIDYGDNALAVDAQGNPSIADLDGNPRIHGASVDCGALEFQGDAAPGREDPSLTVDTAEDVFDLYDGRISLREAIYYARADSPRSTITFDGTLDGATITLSGTSLWIDKALAVDASALTSLTIDGDDTSNVFSVVAGDEVELRGLTVTGGSTTGGGGGIHNAGALAVTDCTLANNTAYSGGGIFNSGTLTVTAGTLSGNASESGGAICNYGTLTVTGSTLVGNSSNYGGGIDNDGTAAVTDCTLAGNSASRRGGGTYNSGTLSVTNTIFAGNAAKGIYTTYGGGIYNNFGTMTVANTTFSGNSADSGGGIYNAGSTTSPGSLMLDNSILWHNVGGNVDGSGSMTASDNLLAINPRFARDPSDGGDGWGDDPDTPDVDESANDDLGDLRLTAQSPAIDYGNDALAVDPNGNPLATDLDGNPRNYDGSPVDVGAYEFQGTLDAGRETVSLVVNTADDVFDLYDDRVSLREAIYYVESDSPDQAITFDAAMDGATITLSGTSLWIDKPLAVDASALTSLTIDADGASRVFTVVGPRDDEVELNGLTVTGGSTEGCGGGIFSTGTLTMAISTLAGNSAGYGGGVYNSGTLTVTDGTLFENSAGRGGGIYSDAGTVTVTNSTLSGNRAGWDQTCDGGAIYNNEGTLTVANSVLSGNLAYSGAGIFSIGMLTVAGSTLSGNAAYAYGGGIRCAAPDAAVTITNTILAKNVAGDLLASADTLTGSHNLIGDGSDWPTFVHGTDGNLVGTSENPIDPLFIRNPSDGGDGWWDDYLTPDVDESANNDYGDLRLLPDSPAVDAGDNALLPSDIHDLDSDGDTAEPIPFDLTGNARVNGGTVDMGTYEYYAPSGIPGDLNNDYTVNSADLDLVRGNWNQDVFPGSLLDGDPSGDGYVGSADLDIVRANWGAVPGAGATDEVFERTLFVDADAAAGGDGLAWATAYDDLQSALESAQTRNRDQVADNDVDAIWIAEGVYRPSAELEPGNPRSASFVLSTGVTLYGGFAGMESVLEDRDWATYETVLSGDLGVVGGDVDNAYTVVHCGEGVTAGLDGVTVTGGNAGGWDSDHAERQKGGGIYNAATLSVTDCTIVDNVAGAGGGIYNAGTLSVAGSTVLNNSTGEVAGSGGGICNAGTLTVIDSTLSGNSVNGSRSVGGGIYNGVSATVTVTNSTLSSNSALYMGGGIGGHGAVTVVGSTFRGNSAGYGGGIGGIGGNAPLTVTAATFLGNSASQGGGIYANRPSPLTVANSTFCGNSATGNYGGGGGIYSFGPLTVVNSTLSNNSAQYGGGIHFRAIGYDILTLSNSILWHNDGGELGGTGNMEASNNLVGIAPRFARNPSDGGDGWGDDPDTPDVDESANDDFGNLRLTAESPAIDYGDDALAVDADGNPLATDRDGSPRYYNGSPVDVGAYEFQGEIAARREAVSLVVNTPEDVVDLYDGRVSLREAIYYATSGSPDGSITFDGALEGATTVLSGSALWLDKGIAIDASALTSMTIDADGKSRVITAIAPGDDVVELNGLRIANGSSDYGGGIYGCGELSVTNCALSDNAASEHGGAIYNGGTLTVSNSTLSGNSADFGGAIYNPRTVAVTNTTFSRNSAHDDGGGICNYGILTITSGNFSGNAAGDGGGVYSTGTLTVAGSVFWDNSAWDGGGIHNYRGTLAVTNSTLACNVASVDGGGIHNDGAATTTLDNTIVAGNEAFDEGSDIDQSSGTLTGSHNLIGDGTGQTGLIDGTDGNLVGTPENPVDPLFVRAPSGDLHLLPHSPAVDTGDNALLAPDTHDLDADGDTVEPIPFDLAGNARVHGASVDMGAYEYYAPSGIPGDLNNDYTVDSADLDLLRGNWNRDVFPGSLLEGDASGDGYVGSADLDIVRANWGTILDAEAVDKLFERTLFVDADAAAGGDGLGWGTAYDDLQSALESAAAFNSDGIAENDVDAIWIAEGVYKPTAELEPGEPRSASFSLADGVTLYGGFAGTETALAERDWIAHETILSGDLGIVGDATDNARTVVFCPRRVVAAVDGVTVTGGNADGIYEGQHRERHAGGGVFNSGTLTVTNSTFLQNTADGGGALFNAATMRVIDSTFHCNAADRGGGVFNYIGTMHVANCAFSGNLASGEVGEGGAIYNLATATIANSTLAGNSAIGGGGIYSYGTLTLCNSILWHNSGGNLDDHKVLSISHTLIGIDPRFARDPSDGGDGWGDDPDTPGVDESANDDFGDLRLTSHSPAIDYGDDAAAVDAQGNPLGTDLDGNPRNYSGSPVDAGAYEFQDAMAAGRETASLTVDTSKDAFDLYDGRISLREAIYYAEDNSPNPTITFDVALDGATIALDGAALWIHEGLTVDAAALESLTIDADGKSRGFAVVSPPDDEVELIGLTITRGSVTHHGGGIYSSGTLTVVACILSDNAAEYGGGISNCGGTLTVLDTTFSDNTAVYAGGGLRNDSGTATVTNGTFQGNSAMYAGGISNYKGTLTITGTALWSNSACQGGALCNSDATLTIIGGTLARNSASQGGGIAAYYTNSSMTLHNTIVAQNAAGSGPDIYQDGGVLTGSHNLIGNGATQMLENGTDGNLVGTPGNPIDPLFVRNPSGGDPGDLHLQPGSPAIDSGGDALLPADLFDLDGDGNTAEPIPIDLAGGARVADGDGDGTSTVDMGAYESAAVVMLEGDLNGDGLVGSLDLDIVRVNWNTNVPAGDLPQGDPSGDGFVGSADLDIVRRNWGNTVAAAVDLAMIDWPRS